MITNEQIEEAQESIFEDKFLNNEIETLYYDNEDSDPVYTGDQIKEAIGLGAHWAIEKFLKELWHDASEEPKKNKQCLIEIIYPRPCGLSDDIDYTTSYFSDYGWNEYNFRFTHYAVSRWLYIDDLTKKGGEE